MLLILTNSTDETANYLVNRLKDASIDFLRFDSDLDLSNVELSYEECEPVIKYKNQEWRPGEFSNVWFRRPQPPVLEQGFGKDIYDRKHALVEWCGALEGFFAHIPKNKWMNHPSLNACASHKMEQLTRASRLGLRIPKTLITQDERKAREFWRDLEGRLIVKPIASGYIERDEPSQDSLIYTNTVTLEKFQEIELVRYCPTLFQEEINKKIDVRITIIDKHFFAISLGANGEAGIQRTDIRRKEMADVKYKEIQIPISLKNTILELVESYGLRFAAIDMAIDCNGDWIFFEINPNGQWAWFDLTGKFDLGSGFISSFSKSSAVRG